MGDMEFNSMLIDVAKHLNDDDIHRMKFMCKDIVKKRDMEKVETALDLFTELQSREKLTANNTSFLKQLLDKCEKFNAIRVIDQFENNRLNHPVASVGNGEVRMDTSPGVLHQALQQAQPVPVVPQPAHQSHNSVASRREDPIVQQQLNALRPEFNFLMKNLSREWRFYLRALGMSDSDVDIVETDYPRSLRDQIYQALVMWAKENKERATKTELIRALRDGSVERFDLASKLEKGNY
ncbi:FAS-associated death domain protein [Mytilus galloprovincialis]|uniref:FAS-associated death domain protein n=1 Tax=Mytilus galloprovincialis TaxID=29158 RepID=A0A8B6EKH2_MYTGA|nr:FAS-associated death domain protein [Mytilus galloprovincialis]